MLFEGGAHEAQIGAAPRSGAAAHVYIESSQRALPILSAEDFLTLCQAALSPSHADIHTTMSMSMCT